LLATRRRRRRGLRQRAKRVERRDHGGSVARAVSRILREHPGAERVERRRDLGPVLADVRRLGEEDLAEHGYGVLTVERRLADEALEEHAAEGEDVGPRVERSNAAGLFRGHVAGRAQERSALRQPGRVLEPRYPEVEHLNPGDVAVHEEDIARLEIA